MECPNSNNCLVACRSTKVSRPSRLGSFLDGIFARAAYLLAFLAGEGEAFPRKDFLLCEASGSTDGLATVTLIHILCRLDAGALAPA